MKIGNYIIILLLIINTALCYIIFQNTFQKNYLIRYPKGANTACYNPNKIIEDDVKLISNNIIVEVLKDKLTDASRNEYSLVRIGNKVWTQQNLRVTVNRLGEPIDYVSDDKSWICYDKPAFCYYSDENGNLDTIKYGCLYNWYAANDPLLPPEGWRVPTDSDWQYLIGFDNSGIGQIGPKIKDSSWGGDNHFSFNAIPAGFRSSYDGKFSFKDRCACFYTSKIVNEIEGYHRHLYDKYDQASTTQTFPCVVAKKTEGYSIRLVIDVNTYNKKYKKY